ncbi:MAG: C39 family peptidase [Clostridiales bacterium]
MNIITNNEIIGAELPEIISEDIRQNYNDTCAIKSQQIILERFGLDISEEQLMQDAERMNIYSPGQGGTYPEDIGKLLEIHGVPCTQHYNATVFDLTAALAKGESIIIGVDSNELWNNASNDQIEGEKADHALIVAGIDTSDPKNVEVILTDPGSGEVGARYPIEKFLDAWHDSGNYMVSTDSPTPTVYNPQMTNFDYEEGHLPWIGNVPFHYFEDIMAPAAHLPMNDDIAEIFYQDVHNMVNGEQLIFSPEFVQHYTDTEYQHNLDLIHTYQEYINMVELNDSLDGADVFVSNDIHTPDLEHFYDHHHDNSSNIDDSIIS